MGSINQAQALFDAKGISLTVESAPMATVQRSSAAPPPSGDGVSTLVLVGIIAGAVAACLCCAVFIGVFLVLRGDARAHQTFTQSRRGRPPMSAASAGPPASRIDVKV